MRGVFFEEEQARAAVSRLVRDGFEAGCVRERFAGEDDDEDQPWVVLTDAPSGILEALVEEHDGWLESSAPPPTTPSALPDGPRRRKRNP